VLPGVPTISEYVPGYEVSSWSGVAAPRNSPAEVIDLLNREINAVLAEPKIRARFAELGTTLFTGSPTEFGKFIADDAEKWGKVIRAVNIRPD
jgi:tripartite-type tricarboxylate transporter receptor subunit TctC